jgi:hypothetical protein
MILVGLSCWCLKSILLTSLSYHPLISLSAFESLVFKGVSTDFERVDGEAVGIDRGD